MQDTKAFSNIYQKEFILHSTIGTAGLHDSIWQGMILSGNGNITKKVLMYKSQTITIQQIIHKRKTLICKHVQQYILVIFMTKINIVNYHRFSAAIYITIMNKLFIKYDFHLLNLKDTFLDIHFNCIGTKIEIFKKNCCIWCQI